MAKEKEEMCENELGKKNKKSISQGLNSGPLFGVRIPKPLHHTTFTTKKLDGDDRNGDKTRQEIKASGLSRARCLYRKKNNNKK